MTDQRIEPRIPRIPLWSRTYQLHYRRQRRSNSQPRCLRQRSPQNSGQYLLPPPRRDFRQCPVGSYHEEERPLRKSTSFPLLTRASLTMRDEQFPMSEYLKDPSVPAGWRTVSYEKPEDKIGVSPDTANLNPDAMDEVFEGGGSDVEPDVE